jgi:hypothetical protein
MTACVRCAEVVSSPLGTCAMRTGSFRTTRAMRRAGEWCVHVRCASGK